MEDEGCKAKPISPLTGKKLRGPLRRISAEDSLVAREVLTLAALILEPDDRTQRRMFAELMPQLILLRKKGRKFAKLTALLNECGFKILPSTVRSYYNEFLQSNNGAKEG